MAEYIIGMDVGGTNFRVGLVNEQGEVEKFSKLSVTEVLKTEDVVSDMAVFLKDFMEDKAVKAIAIGLPAPLDKERKTVLQSPSEHKLRKGLRKSVFLKQVRSETQVLRPIRNNPKHQTF